MNTSGNRRDRYDRRSARSRAELRARRAVLDSLLDETTDVIFAKDRQGRYLLFNAAAARVFGKEAAEVLGRDDRAMFPPDEAARLMAEDRAVMDTGRVVTGEHRLTMADGARRTLHVTKGPIFDAAGQMIGVFGIARDVTERKQVEERLRESEHRFQSLFDNMLEGLASCRMLYENGRPVDWVYLSVNTAFEHLTGLKDVVGKRVTEVIPGLRETNPEVFELYGRVAAGGGPERLDAYLEPLHDWYSISVYSPEPECFVAVFDIVTERKRAEEALRCSEARYRGLFETIPMGLYRTAFDGRILDANPALADLLGFPDRESLLAANAADLYVNRAERDEELRVLVCSNGPTHFEMQLRRRDGTVIWVRDTSRPVCDPDGRLLYQEGSLEDITASRQWAQTLADERRLMRTMIDAMPDHIYVKDAGGRMLLVNEAQARDIGRCSPDETIGKTDFDLSSPDLAARYWETDRTVMESARPVTVEEPYRTAEGETRWVSSIKVPLRDSAGTVLGLVGISRDVTERRQAEEALRDSEQRYHELYDNTSDGIFLLDVTPDGRFRYAGNNAAEERMTGLWNADARGRYVDDVLPEQLARQVIANYRRCVELGAPISYEEVLADLPAGRVCFQTMLIPVRDASGRIYRIIGMARNITERLQAEEALRDSEQRYHDLFDNTSDGIFLLDVTSDGRFKFAGVNAAEERMTGLNPGVSGRYVEDALPERSARRVIANYRRCVEAGAPISYDEIEDALCVGPLHFQTLLIPVRDAAGRIYRIVGMSRDIGERQKLEDQLRQSQKMEALGTLAGGVAHDFNNLLTVIDGNAGLALAGLGPYDPRFEEILTIRKAAERATALTRQLLAFSRRHVLQPKVLDLNHAISDTTRMLRRLIGEDVLLSAEPAPDLGRVLVDPGYLEQVIINLVVNAREAMPHGGRLILRTANADLDGAQVAAHPDVRPGRYVLLTVQDTGRGMDDSTLAHIFEPFFTTKDGGTGLGLATVYGIVKQSGGHIVVDSQPGQGTTFNVFLPRVEGPAERPTAAATVPGRGTETILLVEDEPTVKAFTSRCLRSLGYSVLEAGSGQQGLEVAAAHTGQIDLLITDVVMPHMSGPEMAECLRESKPGLRVLFISGYTAGFFGAGGTLPEVDHLLEKPFTVDELAERVREVLDGPNA